MTEDEPPINDKDSVDTGSSDVPEDTPKMGDSSVEAASQAEDQIPTAPVANRPQLIDSRPHAYSIPDPSEDTDELNEHVNDPGDPDGIVADEERRRWEEAHPAPPPTPIAEYKPRRLWLKIIITILVIAAAAYGAYWIGNHEATKSQTPPKKQQTNQQSQQSQSNPNQSVTYTSTNYSLSFNYLKSWSISDTTTKLTVTSPAMEMNTASGGKASVHVVVTIQNPVKTIPDFPTDGAFASLESQDFTYTQPTGSQSGQTYVSYVGFTSASGLDAVYVTGNSGYQQGQIVPMSDITQVNPFIAVQFETCSDSNCTNGKAVTLNATDWQSSAANKDITTLIESLQLQD